MRATTHAELMKDPDYVRMYCKDLEDERERLSAEVSRLKTSQELMRSRVSEAIRMLGNGSPVTMVQTLLVNALFAPPPERRPAEDSGSDPVKAEAPSQTEGGTHGTR